MSVVFAVLDDRNSCWYNPPKRMKILALTEHSIALAAAIVWWARKFIPGGYKVRIVVERTNKYQVRL